MPGHMGAQRVTLQNLKVVRADVENNILLVKGAIPGCKNGYVMIRMAKKKINKTNKPQAALSKKAKK